MSQATDGRGTTRLTGFISVLGGLALSMAQPGCQDPRIDVYEFLQLQEECARRSIRTHDMPPPHEFSTTTQAAEHTEKADSRGTTSGVSVATDASRDSVDRRAATLKPALTCGPAGVPVPVVETPAEFGHAVYDPSEEGWRTGGSSYSRGGSGLTEHENILLNDRQIAPSDERLTTAAWNEFVPILADETAESQPVLPRPEFARYTVGQGDVLKVSLTGLTGVETLSEATEVLARVNGEGEIHLPLVGAVKVGGLNIEAVEQVILAAYVPRYVKTLALNVELSDYQSADVVVVGAAESPGIVRLPRTQRDVLHAVAAAGGMSQEASGWVTLQRIERPDEKIELFLRDSFDLKTVLALEPLESGDVITVETAQPNTIFVGGLVNAPGPKEFPQGASVNLLQALAAGGGVISDLFPREGTLIRRMPDGRDVQVRIDLERTQLGRDPNIELEAGDIFWVPETVGTRIMAFLNRTLFLRAGATVSYNVTGIEFLNRRSIQGNNQNGGGGGNLRNSVDPLGFLAP